MNISKYPVYVYGVPYRVKITDNTPYLDYEITFYKHYIWPAYKAYAFEGNYQCTPTLFIELINDAIKNFKKKLDEDTTLAKQKQALKEWKNENTKS